MMSTGEKYLYQQKARFRKSIDDLHILQSDDLSSLVRAEHQGWLFHGSPSTVVSSVFVPRPSNLSKQPVVFAGKLWVGLTFMSDWTDEEFEHGTINGEPYMQSLGKSSFDRFKRPGTLYQISPESFTHIHGLTEYEFVSYKSVTPVAAVLISDPLELIKQVGVVLV